MTIIKKDPPRNGRALLAASALIGTIGAFQFSNPPPEKSILSTDFAIAHKTCVTVAGVAAKLPHDPLHPPSLIPVTDTRNGSPACEVDLPGSVALIIDAGTPAEDIRRELTAHNPATPQPVN